MGSWYNGPLSQQKNLPNCNSLMVSYKAPINDQNMYHKAIHNHKDIYNSQKIQ